MSWLYISVLLLPRLPISKATRGCASHTANVFCDLSIDLLMDTVCIMSVLLLSTAKILDSLVESCPWKIFISTFSGQIFKGNLALRVLQASCGYFFSLIWQSVGHINGFENPSQSLASQISFNSLSSTTELLKIYWESVICRHLTFADLHYKYESMCPRSLDRYLERCLWSPIRTGTNQIQHYYSKWGNAMEG